MTKDPGDPDPDGYCRMEECLQFGVPEGILAEALTELLTFYPHCQRCFSSLEIAARTSRRSLSAYALPVTYEDSRGPTCYQHADATDIEVKPLPRWRSLLYATVAASVSSGYLGLSDESGEAAYQVRQVICPGKTVIEAYSFGAAIRFCAAKLGDDKNVESYSAGAQERALMLGLMAYAAASGDPTLRPSWVVVGFDMYRARRWPVGRSELGVELVADQLVVLGAHCRRRTDRESVLVSGLAIHGTTSCAASGGGRRSAVGSSARCR